jgi:hypothetical protein
VAAESQTETLADFARRMHWKRSYVTQLKADDRLVLTADGKRVLVDESIARLKETADPARRGVAERHAAERDGGQPPPDDSRGSSVGSSYQASRAVKERYLALAAKREYDLSMGRLVDAEQLRHAIEDAVVTIRSRLEALPDTLAAQIAAERDEAVVRSNLADAIQDVLSDLSREFAAIGKAEAGA